MCFRATWYSCTATGIHWASLLGRCFDADEYLWLRGLWNSKYICSGQNLIIHPTDGVRSHDADPSSARDWCSHFDCLHCNCSTPLLASFVYSIQAGRAYKYTDRRPRMVWNDVWTTLMRYFRPPSQIKVRLQCGIASKLPVRSSQGFLW